MRGLRQCLKRCRKLTARLWGLHRWAEKLRFVSKRGREEAMTRCFTLKARLHALWPSSLSAPGMNGSVEQESFRGPRKYKTVDGEFQESITLTYDTGQSRAFRSTSFQSSTLEKTLLLCGRVSCRSKQFAQRSLDGGTDIAQRGLLRAEISKHYVHAADGLLVLMGFVRRAGSQEWSKPLVVAAIMLLERYLTTW